MIKKSFSIIAGFLLSVTLLLAQSPQEKEVATAVEALRGEMIDPTKGGLDTITADNLSYGHSSGKVDDKTAFVESLLTGKSDFTAIVLSEQTIKITDHTAIVRHVFKGETMSNGTPGVANINVILVWVKIKNQWKLLARQAVKIA